MATHTAYITIRIDYSIEDKNENNLERITKRVIERVSDKAQQAIGPCSIQIPELSSTITDITNCGESI